MLFQPAIMALLLVDAITLALLLPAALFAIQLLRHWDRNSGHARQIRLERRTALVTTGVALLSGVQGLALLLLVFTADALSVQFVGAMCAVGSFNVNAWGFPALLLRMALFFFAAAWLVMHHLDRQARDYPLIRARHALLLVIAPVALLAVLAQLAWFLGLRSDVITSCCGSLFSPGGATVAAELAALSPLPAMVGFYLVLGATLLVGAYYWRRRRGLTLFALLGSAAFPVAIAAVIAFVSLYIYEHPHHHCPFCLLKAEYGYIGYGLYLPLFGASAIAFGLGLTRPFAHIGSLRQVMAAAVPRVVGIATALFLLFTLLVAWISWHSNLILLS